MNLKRDKRKNGVEEGLYFSKNVSVTVFLYLQGSGGYKLAKDWGLADDDKADTDTDKDVHFFIIFSHTCMQKHDIPN